MAFRRAPGGRQIRPGPGAARQRPSGAFRIPAPIPRTNLRHLQTGSERDLSGLGAEAVVAPSGFEMDGAASGFLFYADTGGKLLGQFGKVRDDTDHAAVGSKGGD